MRILHVVPTYLPATRYGGPIVSVHGLCRALARRGHDVEVITTNVDGPGDSDVPIGSPVDVDGVSVRYFPSRRLRRIYRSPAMGIALESDARRFDVAHLHSVFLWPTMAASRACVRAHVPYVIAPRGMLVRELVAEKNRFVKAAWIHLFERRNFASAAAIHFTSTLEQREAERYALRIANPFVIPNGIDIPDEEPLERPLHDAQRPFILFLGRINWKKGIDRLIRALAFVDDVSLTIAGNDEEAYSESLREIARSEGVLDRIDFVGWVDGTSKAELLRSARALVLPSRNENFGNVILEAMASGCPVITTADVGASEIVAREACGIVSRATPEDLATAIERIVDDPEAMRAMGGRGRVAVERSLTWDAISERMEREYERIVGAGGRQ